MPSEQKIRQNLRAVENAIAQQRLEGLEVPPDVIEEIQRAARGEIEIEAGIRNTIRKFAHGKVRRPRPLP
jgi:Antitoxin VbhA